MTDEEEMAINWIRSQGWNEENLPSDEHNQMMSAYVAGHYDGFQKGIKAKINTTTISDCPIKSEWHDLQKDPNDLPEETEFIESDVLLLLVQLRGTKNKRYELGRYVFSENVFSYTHLKFIEDVVAWCEIPIFEEE